jgi:hypothetical protein
VAAEFCAKASSLPNDNRAAATETLKDVIEIHRLVMPNQSPLQFWPTGMWFFARGVKTMSDTTKNILIVCFGLAAVFMLAIQFWNAIGPD